MCLGVPGKLVSIEADPFGMTMGKVSFGGVMKEVCLAYVPEAQVGDFVLVHVGFAISKIDEQEARQVFQFLDEMGELQELGRPRPPGPAGASTEVKLLREVVDLARRNGRRPISS